MSRLLPHLVWIGGFFLLIVACGWMFFLLKQGTAPAEASAELRGQLHTALVLGVAGSLVFFAGLVWAAGRWLKGFRGEG